MILTVDIGNTHMHLGLFTHGKLRYTWKLSSDRRRTSDEYGIMIRGMLGEVPLSGVIISSVVPRVDKPVGAALKENYHIEPFFLTHDAETGVVNGYARPAEVGMDRLANAAGAYYFFGAPVLVLDFGTAITLDYLEPNDHPEKLPIYRGGAIMPGIELAAESLSKGTALLPKVDLVEMRNVIGRTTEESILSGLHHGYLGAIGTLVERAREEIGMACKVVATGGDALGLKSHMPYLHAVEPYLTLYGLREIYGRNFDCRMPPADKL